MNILYWTDGFWPRLGGIEVQSIHFIRHMQQFGHRFFVVAQQDYPSWPADEVYQNVQIHRADFTSMVLGKNFLGYRKLSNTLENIKNSFKPDLVHLHCCSGPTAFVFWMLKKIIDCPVVLTVHGLLVEDNKVDPIIEWILKGVESICCVSNALLDQLNQYVDANRAICIYNGLAVPTIEPTPLEFDVPTAMMIGRLSPEKGLDTAIHAIVKVKKRIPNVRLLIVGTGPEKLTIEKLITKYELHETVELLGYVSPDEIPRMLNKASMVLTPSRFEAFCLSALQAMQMQRPVIATRIGGLAEVVTHQETGYLIEADAVDELVESIIDLVEHPEHAVQLGLNGRQDATKRFSIERLAAQYHEIYTTLVCQQIRTSHHVPSTYRQLLAN
jgi:glycogen(starch) synthase